VTDRDAPFAEAAERIVDMASIHVDDDGLRLDADASEVRAVLLDLFENERLVDAGQSFDAAIDRTTAAVSGFEVPVR
jgi:hypothetical protein